MNPFRGDARQRDIVIAWCLFLVAFVVRFQNLMLIEHNVDHAYYVGQALRTLDRGEWPIIGQATSLQVPNSAFLGYLYLPLMALTRSVISVYVLVIALNSLSVVFIYRLARQAMGVSGALVASVLFGFNPWMIEYTVSTWSYSIMPFLLCVLAYSIWRMVSTSGQRQSRAVIVAAVCTTMISLVTLTGYFILPTLGVIAVLLWKRLPWRKIVLASVIFVIPTVVFGVALLQQWQQTSSQAATFLGASQAAYFRSEPILHTLRLVNGADYAIQRGVNAPVDDSEIRFNVSLILNAGVALLIVIGCLRLLWQKDLILYRVIIFAFLITPLALMSYNSALVHPFYLMVTLPAGFIAAGAGFAVLWHVSALRFVAVIAITAWGILSLINSTRYYQETFVIPGAHDLTALPLQEILLLGNALNGLVEEQSVTVEVEDWILHSATGRTFPTQRGLDNHERVLIPPEGLLSVTAASDNPEHPLLPVNHLWSHSMADGVTLHVSEIIHDLPDSVMLAETPDAAPTADVTLIGTRTLVNGNHVTMDVYWRVNTVPSDTTLLYSLAVHGYSGSERVLVASGRPVATFLWEPGAIFGHRATFQLDTESAYTLRVGLYDGERGAQAHITGQSDVDGMVPVAGVIDRVGNQNG